MLKRLVIFLKLDAQQIVQELTEFEKPVVSYELKAANIRDYLFSISDELPYQIYIKDTNRKFVWANREMLKACQCGRPEELQGLSDENLFYNPHPG